LVSSDFGASSSDTETSTSMPGSSSSETPPSEMGSAKSARRFDGGGGGIDRESFPAGGCDEARVGGGGKLARNDGGGGGATARSDGGGALVRWGEPGARLVWIADSASAGGAPDPEEVKNSSRRLGPEGLLITRAPNDTSNDVLRPPGRPVRKSSARRRA